MTVYAGMVLDGQRPEAQDRLAKALRAWVRCAVEAELFDRTLPGRWSDRDPTIWIPRPEHFAESARFAAAAAKNAATYVERVLGIGRDVSQRLRRQANEMPYQKQVQFLGGEEE